MSTPRYLVYDIEAVPEGELAGLWKPTPEEIVKAQGDPFPPIYAWKIVSIGCLVLDSDFVPILSGPASGGAANQASEQVILEGFNTIAQTNGSGSPLRLVDFNGRSFDIAVLHARSLAYGMTMKWYFSKPAGDKYAKAYRDRYGGGHFDVFEYLSNYGSSALKTSLDKFAKLIGLPGKTDMDGKEVHQAWKDGRGVEIDRYCMQDVYQTAFLFLRTMLLSGVLTKDLYRARASDLLQHIIKTDSAHDPFIAKIDRTRLLCTDA